MAARDRSPFETFWIAKGAPPGSPREIEDFARRQKRDLRDEMGFSQQGFLPADAPIGAKTVFNQKRDLSRLAEIANSEGSAIQTGSWPDLVGLRENLNENIDTLLENGGAFPEGEDRFTGLRSLEPEEADDIAAQRARDYIVERCEEIDEAGADGADALEAMIRDEPVPDVAGVDMEQVNNDLEEMADEFGLDLVTDAIAECRDRLPGPLEAGTAETQEILDELQERFGFLEGAISLETAVRELEDEVEEARSTASELQQERAREIEQAAANRLARRFGRQFDTLDEAVQEIQEMIARARGERLRIAPIEIRRAGDDFLVRIEDGEDFAPFEGPTRRRIENELDLSNLSTTWTTVGEVRLRGEDLEAIDLEVGRERLGAVATPQPLDIEQREDAGEQADIDAVTAVDQLETLVARGREEGL